MQLTKNEKKLIENIRNIISPETNDITSEDIDEIVELMQNRYIPVAEYDKVYDENEFLQEMYGGLQKDIINEPGAERILIKFKD